MSSPQPTPKIYPPDYIIFTLLFLVSFIIKLPYLGTFLTIDEPRWIEGAGQFLLALHSQNWAETYWHFHPGITITWGEALILWVQSWATPDVPLTTFVEERMNHLDEIVGGMRLSNVFLTSLVLPFIYALAKPLLGQWPAILGVGLLALDPFLVAHTRVVNGDSLSALFMMASFLAFTTLFIKPNLKYAIYAGIFAGLAFLTKLPSPMLVPILALLALLGFARHRDVMFWLKSLLLSGVAATIVFILVWPAMWVGPIDTLQLMFEDTFDIGDIGGKETVSFFLGEIRERQSLLYYPLATLFRLTPLNLIGFIIALGLLFISKRLPSNNEPSDAVPRKLWLLLLIAYIILVVSFASISPKKEDRYVMSIIPAINLLAGVGIVWGLQSIVPKGASRQKALIIAGLIAVQAGFVVWHYPYVLTYYNPLLGGYAAAAELVPVGRGEGLEKAAAWINNQPEAASTTVSPFYRNVTNPYLTGKSLGFSNSGESQVLADYVVFYITQTQRKLPYPGLADYFLQQDPVYTDYIGNTPYLWVYKKERPVIKLNGKPKIVGRARLVGYSKSPSSLKAGDIVPVTLYFLTEDQDLPPNENFRVSLLDGAGNVQTDWQGSPENRWLPNSVVAWQGDLSLNVSLSEGDYRLKVSLIDMNTGGEVTFFDFDDELWTIAP
ncbi:MAG: glycosyltransferase family 39 protein [Chloroflexota bacterium]